MSRAKKNSASEAPERRDANVSYAGRPVNPERARVAREFATGSVLDIGCGAGQYVHLLDDGRDILGIDLESYETWKSKPELFRKMGVEALGTLERQFDTVLAFEVLEHLEDPAAALLRFRSVCREKLIISVPNCREPQGMKASNLLFRHWFDRTHVNFFDSESICQAVEAAGFQVEQCFLFNKINLAPLLVEVVPFLAPVRKVLWRLSEWLLPQSYCMSIMVQARVRRYDAS